MVESKQSKALQKSRIFKFIIISIIIMLKMFLDLYLV